MNIPYAIYDLALEKLNPFLFWTIDEEISIAVGQRNDLPVDKLGLRSLDTLIFRIKVLHVDGEMVHRSFGRQFITVSLNQFNLCFITTIEAKESELNDTVRVSYPVFQFESYNFRIETQCCLQITYSNTDIVSYILRDMIDS
mgnify:CR=1 FL=1